MEQGTQEWFSARLGKVTGSCFQKVLSGRQTAATYKMELVSERLTGQSPPQVSSKAMAWGHEHEDKARIAYSLFLLDKDDDRASQIKQVGFVDHPEVDGAGCSPDGLVGDDGVIEIKCPYTHKNHLRTLMTREVPKEYVAQCQGAMWVLGKSYCDFISYHPHFGSSMELCVLRLERSDEYIANLCKSVQVFLDEIEVVIKQLKERYSNVKV